MKIYMLILVLFIATMDRSFGQEFTADNGDHALKFDSIDIQIIQRAYDLLIDEPVWDKVDERECQDDIDANKYSLFCAHYKASLDITGVYDHRKPGLQQIRWEINDKFRDRWDNHRLMDFNNHPDTTFDEIKHLLAASIKIINQKIKAEYKS